MCSFSWRKFDSHIGVAFNRDESNLRAKAIPPQVYSHEQLNVLMPKDPDGGGSWLAVNQFGFLFVLLNNYQGIVKANSDKLISRGKIIANLAKCRTKLEIEKYIDSIDLINFQAFSLICISHSFQSMWLHHGDNQLLKKAMPYHWFSSAHPNASQVIKERKHLAESWPVNKDQDLIALHKSHDANNRGVDFEDRTYSICMHHEKGQSQSLTYVRLLSDKVELEYWDGQPCQTTESVKSELVITDVI